MRGLVGRCVPCAAAPAGRARRRGASAAGALARDPRSVGLPGRPRPGEAGRRRPRLDPPARAALRPYLPALRVLEGTPARRRQPGGVLDLALRRSCGRGGHERCPGRRRRRTGRAARRQDPRHRTRPARAVRAGRAPAGAAGDLVHPLLDTQGGAPQGDGRRLVRQAVARGREPPRHAGRARGLERRSRAPGARGAARPRRRGRLPRQHRVRRRRPRADRARRRAPAREISTDFDGQGDEPCGRQRRSRASTRS